MEVAVAVPPPPPPPMDFNFDSNCSSPYTTAPSSPQRFSNFFFSAPTSPTHSLFLHSSAPKPTTAAADENFEFDFSSHLERPSLPADELFHGGQIRPFKLNQTEFANKIDHDERSSKRAERASSFSLPSSPPRRSSLHRGSRRRSLSMVSEIDRNSINESGDVFPQIDSTTSNNKNSDDPVTDAAAIAETASTFSSFLQSISFAKGYRKWRLKDFLLFRSASEGRATDKDPLRKFAAVDVAGGASFRSTESSGSVSRRRGPVSAHEMHYTLNRAASVELRRKTLLPYKQGLLGCLGFNQGMRQISGRYGSMERS